MAFSTSASPTPSSNTLCSSNNCSISSAYGIKSSTEMMRLQRGQTQRRVAAATALSFLLALLGLCTVGSNAGAVPARLSTLPFAKYREQPQQTARECVAAAADATTGSSEQGRVSRGGASFTAASTADSVLGSTTSSCSSSLEQLRLVGPVIGIWLTTRQSLENWARSFWSDAQRTKFLLAGAVAGIVSRTVVSPLEVVATAQMVRGGDKNTWTELSELLGAEGIRGFFKGNGANCLKVAPTRGVQFFAFESFKNRLVLWKRRRRGLPDDAADVGLTPLERLVAGGFAGMIASSMVYPLEVVKTMLTMYPGKYPGIGAAFRGVIAEAGPAGLYRGLAPTLVAMFPYVGVEFMIYESSKIALEEIWKRAHHAKADGGSTGDAGVSIVLPTIVSLGLGALAGAAAQTSAHPLDVVRKRLQVQGINGNPVIYKTTLDCFFGVASKEGFAALYKGLGPACVATIPGTGVAYIVYETMKKVLGLSSV